MMPFESTSAGTSRPLDLTTERLRPEVEKWMEFNADYIKEFGEHERAPELLEKRAEAERMLAETELLYGSTDQAAPEQIQKNWERLKTLYREANDIRAEMAASLNRTIMHAEKSQNIGALIETDVSRANFAPQTLENLQPIIQGLGVDPLAITAESKNRINRYYDRESDGELNVNIATIRGDLEALQKIRERTQDMKQHATLDRLTGQLINLEKIDPIRREIENKKLNRHGPHIDDFWRKALLGIGVVYTVWAASVRNWKFAAPAGLATFFLWRGLGDKNSERVAYLNQPEIQKLLLRTFNSSGGAKAVEEYFSVLRGSNPQGKELWKLAKESEITDVQLNALFGTEQSILKDELLKMDSFDRARVLRVLGGVTDKKAQEITVQYIGLRSTPTKMPAPEPASKEIHSEK